MGVYVTGAVKAACPACPDAPATVEVNVEAAPEAKEDIKDDSESRFPPILRDTMNSPCRQLALLAGLIAWAVFAGFGVRWASLPILVAVLAVLVSISVFTAAVVFWRKADVIGLISITTFALYLNAVVSILIPGSFYQSHAVLASLALPYMVMCFKQAEKMHIVIVLFVVVPTIFVATVETDLPSAYRCICYLPAMLFYLYKMMAMGCASGKYNKLLHNGAHLQICLRVSAVAILIGAALSAAAPAWNLGYSPFSVVGPTLLWIAGVAFNCFLVIQRWEDPTKIPKTARAWAHKRGVSALGVCSLMCLVLTGIYMSLQSCRVTVIPLVLAFFALYLLFIKLQHPIRRRLPNVFYLLLILGCLACMIPSTAIQFPLHDQQQRIVSIPHIVNETSVEWVEVETPSKIIDESARQDSGYFVNIQFFLFFVYFMFTALVNTDKYSERAIEAFIKKSEAKGKPASTTDGTSAAADLAAAYVSFEMMMTDADDAIPKK